MFKVLEHVFSVDEHMFAVHELMFSVREHKILLGENNFPAREKCFFSSIEEKKCQNVNFFKYIKVFHAYACVLLKKGVLLSQTNYKRTTA